ncbi:MAG: SPOR domain-containing protein [Paludibacteraceae bacterium]
MKKIFGLFLLSVIILNGATSCKSKQKVVNISGSEIQATEKTTTQQQPVAVAQENESNTRTINEKFNMADGETNTAAFYKKFHVVVGSFGKQENAKNLQRTLNSEGNNAIVVVNEQGMYRVLIASYDEYTQAHERINQIKTRFPDAWVLMQK